MKQTGRISLAIWLAIGSTTGLGCRSIQTNQSKLIPQMVASPAGPMRPLHTATLVYRIQPVADRAKVSQAARTTPFGSPQPAAKAGGGAQLLVIRYPNPSGKRDSALAELVVTEPVSPADSSPGSSTRHWHDRWSGWLRESLPGIGWDDGVREAKALTIPVQELKFLLTRCQGLEDVQLASHGSSNTEAMLLVDVNDKPVLQPHRQSPELDALVRKIRDHGRLITCLVGSGAQLAEMARGADSPLLATLGASQDHLLVRMPPAFDQD